ncbi:MAG: hypothetical protein OQJ95_02590 [Kangiella sp.]|jgi:hypothetical protein|nr:hypothetical protein [Kangiella sp.]
MNKNYYMQVHLRIYKNGTHYESIAINAKEGCYQLETDLVSSHHEVTTDPAGIHSKVFQINLNLLDSSSSVVMHVPIHQSSEWEVIKGTDIYTIGFYCILGEQGEELLEINSD